MTKRELIQALEASSVEDWAPVLVSSEDPHIDVEIAGTVTIHTNKRQEVIITLDNN